MKLNKDTILYIILALVILLAIYLFIKTSSLEERNAQLMQQLMYSGGSGDKSGRAMDPYIQNQVKNTITKHLAQIQECYKTFLNNNADKIKKDKNFKKDGSVSVDWHVNSKGEAVSPEIVRSEINDDNFKICLIEKIKSWSFPAPPFGTDKYVEHTFRFMDKEEKK
jgi:hypothetical protein